MGLKPRADDMSEVSIVSPRLAAMSAISSSGLLLHTDTRARSQDSASKCRTGGKCCSCGEFGARAFNFSPSHLWKGPGETGWRRGVGSD